MRFHPRPAIVTTLALAALPLPLHAVAAQASDQAKPSSTVTTSTTSSSQPANALTTTTSTTSTTSTHSTSTATHSTAFASAPAVTGHHGTSASAHRRVKDKHGAPHARAKKSPLARTASDPPVAIANFAFSPASVTIKVGDTITWTNNDAIPHTATASDGSFDTGTLKKGQSGSHTFATAGTFAYICSIHPNMHGTVVVQGSSSGNSGNGNGSGSGSGSGGNGGTAGATTTPSGSGTTPAATTTPATASAPSLPNTGTDLGTTLLVGGLMIGTGLAVRRRVRSH
jgi:LPXTG-motif cell wall-anchored protein